MNIATYADDRLLSRKAYAIVQSSIFTAVAVLYVLSFFVKYNQVQTRRDASGFEHHYAAKFFYFYYYTGYFPLATLDTTLVYSRQAAMREIEQDGKDLIMEYKHWARLGEHARIFCYLPHALLTASARAPSIRLFNAVFFLLGLLFLYRGFYKVHMPLMGLLLCMAILATPYFHYEVFRNENIFALQPSVFLMILGMLLPFFFGKANNNLKQLATVVFSSILVAFCSEIRNEVSVVFICVLLLILLSAHIRLLSKLLFIATGLICFTGSKKIIQMHFDHKFYTTKQLVASKGGHVYTGNKIAGHNLWHPVFCGLGDYDRKYGYAWNDTIAYEYAVPIMNSKYGLNIQYSGKLHTDNYYDSAKLYYVKFDEIPEYETIVRDKVIHDVKSDPVWYLKIIFQRIIKICTDTLPFPFLGFVTLVCMVYFVVKRKHRYVRLILIFLPLSATSLLIYSGKGAAYNSLFGYFVLAILIYSLLERFKMKDAAIK